MISRRNRGPMIDCGMLSHSGKMHQAPSKGISCMHVHLHGRTYGGTPRAHARAHMRGARYRHVHTHRCYRSPLTLSKLALPYSSASSRTSIAQHTPAPENKGRCTQRQTHRRPSRFCVTNCMQGVPGPHNEPPQNVWAHAGTHPSTSHSMRKRLALQSRQRFRCRIWCLQLQLRRSRRWQCRTECQSCSSRSTRCVRAQSVFQYGLRSPAAAGNFSGPSTPVRCGPRKMLQLARVCASPRVLVLWWRSYRLSSSTCLLGLVRTSVNPLSET